VRAPNNNYLYFLTLVPPKEVKITGVNEAKVGDTINLICATSNSNPKADIAWFKGGVGLDGAITASSISADGGWTTQSNVTFTVEPGEGTFVVTCQGMNKGLGESKVASHTINVIRPPGHPVIYKTSLNFSEGHPHKLTCTSTGGHPVANLQWYREDKKVKISKLFNYASENFNFTLHYMYRLTL
jgi:hypothetical protein